LLELEHPTMKLNEKRPKESLRDKKVTKRLEEAGEAAEEEIDADGLQRRSGSSGAPGCCARE
jgi:hypothetical protein